jgi:amicyanin
VNSAFRAAVIAAAVGILGPIGASAQGFEVLTQDPAVAVEADNVVEMDIAEMKFGQPELVVPAGTVVTWTNRDPVPHNVHFTEADSQGPMLRASQSYSVRFDEPGTYGYICTPHPFMTGSVTVE